MSNTAVPLTNSGRGYTLVTHVISPQTCPAGEQCHTSVQNPLGKFLKGEPKALGTAQIIIGLFTLGIGIVKPFARNFDLSFFTYVIFWGPLFYIVSGSLTVAASNKLNHCVVVASLVMNILTTLSASVAIILFSLDLGLFYSHYHSCSSYSNCKNQVMAQGIAAVLLVFALLQFFISIYVSVFSCKASCHKLPPVNITVVANPEESGSTAIPMPIYTNQQVINLANSTNRYNPPVENPPEYSDQWDS